MRDFFAYIRKKRGLRIRLLVIFLILIYIPMALNIYFVYTRTINAVEREKIRDAEQILKKTSETIDFTLTNIEEIVDEIANQNGVRKGIEDFEKLTAPVQEKISRFLGERADKAKTTNYFIDQIIYVTESGRVFNFGGEITIDINEFTKGDLYNELELENIDKKWKYISAKQLFNNTNEENLMVLINRINSVDETKNVGHIFTIINKASFESLYKDIILGTTGNMGVYDNLDNPVLGRVHHTIPEELFDELLDNRKFNSMNRVTSEGADYYIGTASLRPIEWKIKAVIPLEDLTGDIKKNLKSSFWLIGVISILLSVWIIIEIVILSKVITEKEVAHYRLVLSEEMNTKLRVYKHDFMNHLQVISGLIELNRPDRAVEYLKNVTKEGSTINDKYEIGIPELESVVFSAISEAQNKGIDVEIDSIRLPDNLPVNLYDLIKIISNLIKNGIQALESYEGKEKKLKIEIYEELDEYVFEITNNRPIIPESIREQIFDKGYSTKGKKGRGLGLYIVERLVEKYNGIIELQVDEEGNHFIIRFPYNL